MRFAWTTVYVLFTQAILFLAERNLLRTVHGAALSLAIAGDLLHH